MDVLNLSKDFEYLLIFLLILVLPQILLRFKIPSGLTALLIGVLFGTLDKSLVTDELIKFLSQVGITSLFLFAGLEIEAKELKDKKSYLSKYLLKYNTVLLVVAILFFYFFEMEVKYAVLLSLGLFTPSAGFIVSSLQSYNFNEKDESWIKSKAFSKEIISIAILFIILQYDNPKLLLLNVFVFLMFYLILPKIIVGLIRFISSHAPNTEVSFLVALSLLFGIITKEMGTYYIVGSFMVGLIANKYKRDIFHDGEAGMLKSLADFFSVFLPFYFFHTGLWIDIHKLSGTIFVFGIAYFIIFAPLRFALTQFGFFKFGDKVEKNHYKISLTLMPTLVFGLIIAKIIVQQKPEHSDLAYGLIVYTILTSILPAFFFHFGSKRVLFQTEK